MKFKKLFQHDIVISASHNNGIIVKVGCGTFCYSGAESFLHDLTEFFKDPERWQKEYTGSGACEAEVEPRADRPQPQSVTGSGR